jgi:hypothetical protein
MGRPLHVHGDGPQGREHRPRNLRDQDGKIVAHTDVFDFWRWSRQALGAPGLFLGWTSFLQRKVQGQAAKGLSEYEQKKRAG